MKLNAQDNATAKRKPYVKPQVKQVLLRPEEAVLGTCKTSGSGKGPMQSSCRIPRKCSSVGS